MQLITSAQVCCCSAALYLPRVCLSADAGPGTGMVTLADARNNSAKPGSVGGDLLVLLSGAAYAVCLRHWLSLTCLLLDTC